MSQIKDTYLGNNRVKKDGVVQALTTEEFKEYYRCASDPIYFIETYGRVVHLDKGIVPLKLYPYQADMIQKFIENRHCITLACRQSGKTIGVLAYLLWYCMFEEDKIVAILANKGATARKILARFQLMLENLPFFLQPGVKVLNRGDILFSNGTKIYASSTSSDSIRGDSVNLLYLDEFAFIDNDAEFYTSTYPVITGGKTSKIIITSTANGVNNTFYKLYEGAVQGTNTFFPHRVDWWDVPGRDEQWKKETIDNTSEYQFEQEFGNSFHSTGTTLIAADVLLSMKAQDPIFKDKDNSIRIYHKPEEGHEYVMAVDVCKGRGQDYSTFSIIDVTVSPYQQVAAYRNNLVSPLFFPEIIYRYGKMYNEAFIIVESNDQGSMVASTLNYEYEYPNLYMESFLKNDGIGMTMTRKVKRIGCSNLKDLLESGRMCVNDAQTIIELTEFAAKGTSFEATPGNHDDTVIPLVLFSYFTTTSMFLEMSTEDLRMLLFKEKMRMISDDLPGFGHIDTGLNGPGDADVVIETKDTQTAYKKDDLFRWVTEVDGNNGNDGFW